MRQAAAQPRHPAPGERLRPQERMAWHGLFRAAQQILRRVDAELLRRYDLPVTGAELLYLLRHAGAPIRVTDLSERVLISQSSVSRTVERMERRGLVRRGPSSDDGRATVVSITAAGTRLLQAMRATEEEIVAEMLVDRLDAAQVGALVDAWRTLEWVSLDPHVPVQPQ